MYRSVSHSVTVYPKGAEKGRPAAAARRRDQSRTRFVASDLHTATVVIGGLVSATILTLLVLPALYAVFGRDGHRRNQAC